MFVVVYDACVLYPASLRDLLVRLAMTGLFQAKWTDQILDECFDNIVANRPDLKIESLARTRQLMNRAVPDAIVTGYDSLIAGLDLPDEEDRHVLAAAIRCGAQVIVTSNMKHFPEPILAAYDIEAQDPDTFVLHVLSLSADVVASTVIAQAATMRNPPHSPLQLVELLRKRGLITAADRLRELLSQ
ncbi:MAG TPA: PIN domain-containing protein [Anaeromyxobacteraceae bacterium]|nr:PIN domain-containing protein [Anaeromyxobacteraceae bacterium]